MSVRAPGSDALLAAALASCALALYLASLPPSFAFWDTGELQTVAAILGIAHPPACPAFVLLGWLFVHALPLGEPAWRVNAMCALAMALGTGLLFVTQRAFGVPRIIAIVCTCGFAAASVPWRDATRAEVQDVSLLFRAAALLFALRFYNGGLRRDLFFAALATGLAAATHGIVLLLVPALLVLVAARPESRSVRAFALVLGGVALGLLPYVYLPLRSAAIARGHYDPTLTLGLPVGLPFWNYDDPQTWPNLVRVITGADFDVHSGFAGFINVAAYPQYAAALVKNVSGAYGLPGCVLAAFGCGLLVAKQRVAGCALVLAALLPVPYTESYNELQDPSRYYLFTLWCAAIAIGVAFESLANLIGLVPRSIGRFGLAAALVASFVGASPDRPSYFAQTSDRSAARYVDDIVALTPRDAVVVAEWAFATPLAYAAYVQRRFGDRIVVSASPSQFATLYGGWLRRRPVYIVSFDDALTLPGYRIETLMSDYVHAYRVIGYTRGAPPR